MAITAVASSPSGSLTIPSLGVLIWLSVKPLIRIIFPAGVGFLLVKMKTFPANGTRPASILVLNLTLPCLLFSKVVPSFNSGNINYLGPIFLTAIFYQALSAAMGMLARATTQTPRRFRYGIIPSYAFSNWGDLPTAVLVTLAGSAPFNGAEDEALAIAIISIFILTNQVAMWPCQGLRFVRMDYEPNAIDPVLEARYEAGEWGTTRKYLNRLRRGKPMAWEMEEDKGKKAEKMAEEEIDMAAAMEEVRNQPETGMSSASATRPTESNFPTLEPTASFPPASLSTHPKAYVRVLHSVISFIGSFCTPVTLALFVALIIALVPNLKTLFVYTAEASYHPTAPGGQEPPLAVIYQTASFVGAASVPLGLVVLGASIAKMEIPRPINRLPLASIASMAAIKLIALPIIGYFFVEGLVKHTGMVAADNYVLRFTLIYFSCVPTGTIQIAFSQLFAPADQRNNSELLSAYILAQYVVFVFSSVILTAVTLNTIF